jgi:RNA polymerase sigma factor (sigma-70 family)
MLPDDLYAALAAAADGDRSARNRVVLHGLGLARYVVRRYAPLAFAKGIMSDELMQQAALGLIGAAETYNPRKGAAWSTYAVRCVANRVQGWLDEQLRYLRRKIPLDVPARGRLRSIAATMPDYDAQADIDAVIDRIAREQAGAVIRRALAALPEDECEVTMLYFGMDPRTSRKRVTVRDVADMLGVPVHYVTSRLARARYRLRKLLPRDLLEVY